MAREVTKVRHATKTSSFGVGKRESHDSSEFYSRFVPPTLSDDEMVAMCDVADTLFLGDSRDMSKVADKSVSLVTTSPPYHASKEYEIDVNAGHVPKSYVAYLELLHDVFAECQRVLEPGGRIAVNVANLGRKPFRSLSKDVWVVLEDLGFLPRGEIVWTKAAGSSGNCAWGSWMSPSNPSLRDLTERILIASKGRFDRALHWKVRRQRGLPWESTIGREDFMAWTLDTWDIRPESAKMDLQLKNKVAVVTGGSKGIGLAIVRTLAAEGAHVVAGALTIDELQGIDAVTPLAVDLIKPGGSERLIAEAVERHGHVDILVNNVGGVKLRLEGFLAIPDSEFEHSFQLNFFAALRATRAAVAEMIKQGEGAIVNVASVNAFYHPDGLVVDYGAAKAALLNVAKALSQELGPKGIRINSVSPGPVATDLWLGDHGVAATLGAAAGIDASAVREKAVSGMATGRFTTPDEVATLVALLASPRTANVTGSNYVIDGGLVKTM